MFEQITLIGNATRDPEMRYTGSGQAVTSLNVAVNRTYTNSAGEKVEEVHWWKVSCWGKLAEIVNTYVHKGSKLFIQGRMQADEGGNPRIWNRTDGTPAASFELTANEVKFLNRVEGGAGEQAGEAADEIPF